MINCVLFCFFTVLCRDSDAVKIDTVLWAQRASYSRSKVRMKAMVCPEHGPGGCIWFSEISCKSMPWALLWWFMETVFDWDYCDRKNWHRLCQGKKKESTKKMKWNTFALIKGKIWSDVMNNRGFLVESRGMQSDLVACLLSLISFWLFAFEFRYLRVFGVQWQFFSWRYFYL